jgi:DNA repair exonuclease SbcCD nuclease subunit
MGKFHNGATVKELTFIHTSDLHLGTPFKGLSSVNPDLAERIKDATYSAFQKIVDLCISDQVDFLIIAGDVFDSEYQSLSAQLMLIKELEKLSAKGIPTYIVAGNHDPYPTWPDHIFSLPHIHIFGTHSVEKVEYQKQGETLAAMYGISFPKAKVQRNLSKLFPATPSPAPFSVAILHGTTGETGDHVPYAPFQLKEILAGPFDYWALGHIHKHQVLHEAFPAVVYSGNPQGRDFGEKGLRGCYKVSLREGERPELKFIPVQTIQFEELSVDCTDVNSVNQLKQKIDRQIRDFLDQFPGISFIFRIFLEGSTELHGLLQDDAERNELQEILNAEWGVDEPFVWIDKLIPRTSPVVDLETLKHQSDFVGELLKEFEAIRKDPEALSTMLHQIRTIPGIRRSIRERITSDEKALLDHAQWLILQKLMKDLL